MSENVRLSRHAGHLIERGWTQHADARAADDSIVNPCDARAVSWSLLGALVAAVEHIAAAEGEPTAIGQLARTCILLANIVDTDSLEEWNDAPERVKDDLLAALDQATADEPGEQDDFRGFSPN